MKNITFILLVFILFVNKAYLQESAIQPRNYIFNHSRDSVSFDYNNYETFKTINGVLNYSHQDSIISFLLNGKTNATIYDNSFKNQTIADIRLYAKVKNNLSLGSRTGGNFISNDLFAYPNQNNLYFIPEIIFNNNRLNSGLGIGYVTKKDNDIVQDGFKLLSNVDYKYITQKNGTYDLGLNLTGDNLDSLENYSFISNAKWANAILNNSFYWTISSSYNSDRYHYIDLNNKNNRVNSNKYFGGFNFFYDLSNYFDYSGRFIFNQNQKNIYIKEIKNRETDELNFLIGNNIAFKSNKFNSIFTFDYTSGGENFYHLDNKNNYSDYSYKLASTNIYFKNSYKLALDLNYYKYTYKSLNSTNSNDRDIMQFGISPKFTYNFSKKIILDQNFPFEFYHLVYIPEARSNNNYKDRILGSITTLSFLHIFGTDISTSIVADIKSRYHVFDFDTLYTKSFILKDYTFSDTIKYNINKSIDLKNSLRYTYEEFGRLNWSKFSENPIYYKNYVYDILSLCFSYKKSTKFLLEYFYYEIDSFDTNQDDFSKSKLQEVRISHGPQISSEITVEKLKLKTILKRSFTRNKKGEIIFKFMGIYQF